MSRDPYPEGWHETTVQRWLVNPGDRTNITLLTVTKYRVSGRNAWYAAAVMSPAVYGAEAELVPLGDHDEASLAQQACDRWAERHLPYAGRLAAEMRQVTRPVAES